MEGDPIPWGVVKIQNGRIEAVETEGAAQAEENLGQTILLPGLVNVHTHLDLSDYPASQNGIIDFIPWLDSVIAHRLSQSPEQKRLAIQKGIEESLRGGVALVGDISSHGDSFPLLQNSPLYSRVYFELIGLTRSRSEECWKQFASWIHSNQGTEKTGHGISPHAPYSVHKEAFLRAGKTGLPTQVHLGESLVEMELLAKQVGLLEKWLAQKGLLDKEALCDSMSGILRDLSGSRLLVVVHGTRLDFELLPSGYLAICPRTQARFEQGELPLLAACRNGWKVALGTDGLSSAPDLNVLNEARLVRKNFPEFPVQDLLRAITLNGAEQLGFAEKLGSITPGKTATFSCFPIPPDTHPGPLEFLFGSSVPCSGLMIDGKWIFQNSFPNE